MNGIMRLLEMIARGWFAAARSSTSTTTPFAAPTGTGTIPATASGTTVFGVASPPIRLCNLEALISGALENLFSDTLAKRALAGGF
jgi:hypothetical protein